MTRAGREPAEDPKRRLVAVCQEVGLRVSGASMHLSHEAGTRVVHVHASPEDWPGGTSVLSIVATIRLTGEWPETVDIRCSASDGDPPPMNCPWMRGRDQVPWRALVDELRETLSEREQVMAAMKSRLPGPYRFEHTVWQPVDLLGPLVL